MRQVAKCECARWPNSLRPNTSVENDLNDIFKNIKLYNLDLVLFEYKQNNIKLTLASKNKEDLYQFLKEYKETLISSSILFDENKKTYEMVAYAKSIK